MRRRDTVFQRRTNPGWSMPGGAWEGSQGGAALVEAALTLPLFVLIFAFFWDASVASMMRIRHQSAMVQAAIDFRQTPLHAVIDSSGGFPKLVVSQLGGDDLVGDNGLLQTFNKMIADILRDSGSGASYMENSVVSELWYVQICTDPSGGCPKSAPIGSAIRASLAGTDEGLETAQYTKPVSTACFDRLDTSSSRFTEYVKSQIDTILAGGGAAADAADPGIPFGTVLLDIDTGPAAIGLVQQYLEWRPVLFVAICSYAPQFLSAQPSLSFVTHFFDKQVSRPL